MKRQLLVISLGVLLAPTTWAQSSRTAGLLSPFPFLQQMEVSLGMARSGSAGGMRFVSSQMRKGRGYFFDYGSLQPGAFTLGSGISNQQVSFLGLGAQTRQSIGRSFLTAGIGLYRADHEQPFFDSGPDRILSSVRGLGYRYGLGYQVGTVSLQLSLTHLPRPRTTNTLNGPVSSFELGYRF
jgi:hypothetical protein